MAENTSKHTPSDIDIMMYFDGELSGDEAKAVESYLSASEEAAARQDGLAELGELMRGHVELETDAAEAKLAGLWKGIESAIDESKDDGKVVPMGAARAAAEERATQALVDKAGRTGWFGGWQSHIATGALVAAAVAVLMFTTRPERIVETKTTVREQGGSSAIHVANPNTNDLRSQEPIVEELEVYEGSGVIMTVHSDDDDSDSAVIWISNDTLSDDTDLVEEPI